MTASSSRPGLRVWIRHVPNVGVESPDLAHRVVLLRCNGGYRRHSGLGRSSNSMFMSSRPTRDGSRNTNQRVQSEILAKLFLHTHLAPLRVPFSRSRRRPASFSSMLMRVSMQKLILVAGVSLSVSQLLQDRHRPIHRNVVVPEDHFLYVIEWKLPLGRSAPTPFRNIPSWRPRYPRCCAGAAFAARGHVARL
jgi:hypothetical protein